jgi:hypothetical protein
MQHKNESKLYIVKCCWSLLRLKPQEKGPLTAGLLRVYMFRKEESPFLIFEYLMKEE